MGPDDRERRDPETQGLSSLAEGYRKAAPYIGAAWSLVASVAVFTLLGWWLDQKMGNRVPWFLLLGAALGMTGGFISFFRTVLGTTRKPK